MQRVGLTGGYLGESCAIWRNDVRRCSSVKEDGRSWVYLYVFQLRQCDVCVGCGGNSRS